MAAANTVTVACKIQNGLRLRGGSFYEVSVPVLGGGLRVEKQWRANGTEVLIKGPGRDPARGDDPSSPNNDGYALTFGVDAEFMEAWLKDNADLDAVKNGLILVHSNKTELKAQTREFRDQRTGLEPLSQAGDPRVPKKVGKADRD